MTTYAQDTIPNLSIIFFFSSALRASPACLRTARWAVHVTLILHCKTSLSETEQPICFGTHVAQA